MDPVCYFHGYLPPHQVFDLFSERKRNEIERVKQGRNEKMIGTPYLYERLGKLTFTVTIAPVQRKCRTRVVSSGVRVAESGCPLIF